MQKRIRFRLGMFSLLFCLSAFGGMDAAGIGKANAGSVPNCAHAEAGDDIDEMMSDDLGTPNLKTGDCYGVPLPCNGAWAA